MEAAAPARQHGSPIARASLLAYICLIVYASWFPFTGWRVSGLPPLSYLTAGLPHYWTRFDVLVNVIGYVPFGVLLVFAVYPRVRGLWAVLLASLTGVLVSGSMEAVQTFLPSRVPSVLDLLTNSLGCALGAVYGALKVRAYLEQGRLLQLRQRWFAPHASQGLVLVALWPLAEIYPQSYLFGHGQILPEISEWLSALLETPVDPGAFLRRDDLLTAEQYWLSETIITACQMTGAVLVMLCLLRREAPRARLILAMLGAAIVVKCLASAVLFEPESAFGWITPGAQGGFVIGLIMIAGLAFAPKTAQRRLAVLSLGLSLLVLNAIPVNPYFIATMQTWTQGQFLNFNGAAQFLSLLWPFVALWFLILPSHKLNKS
ncbi:VanZ family protein [Massilia sp. TS11]|uniref:VanZ family protein n=1 Tax=Massilia sp. TS11 TaxID=2908003 RepID=UPI001EDA5916|nr:VanZ family protein [Massilia sp. TS11]MCG2586603.1 VanZ family protein [Massilia sp. TS11]